MNVVRVNNSTKPTVVPDVASPSQPCPGEVLIRVYAAAVTPTELLWYPTTHTKSGEPRSGAIPGHEFSGVVVANGASASTLDLGVEVFGMNDWFSDGAMAEYCIAPISSLARKPIRLSHAEAAAVPISALTAWQGLFDRAKILSGERLLVHGGAGAVGAYAVQLAHLHGVHVTATASGADVAFVKKLGAEEVIDYRASRFEQCVSDIDVVFDTVGGETLERSWNVVKPQGRMITIAAGQENIRDPRARTAFFIVEPNRKQLTMIADLLEAGQLRAFVDAVVPLSQAPKAYAAKTPKQHPGKVVVAVVNQN